MGGLLTVPAFLEQYPQINIVDENSFHNAWVTGLTVGTWNLGCVVSAVLAIFISDGLGRRKTLLLGITLWAIGELIQVTSYSFAQLIVGRAIAGFGKAPQLLLFIYTVLTALSQAMASPLRPRQHTKPSV
jgi:MFS family permease